MSSNTRNAYGLKSGANKLTEVGSAYALMQKAIIDVTLLSASIGTPLTAAQVKAIYESNPDTNAYTDDEKAKLAALEDSKYKGVFINLSSLQEAYPVGEAGWYALVDDGQVSVTYAWEVEDWIQVSTNSNLTASQVKELYESNPDTNAYSNAELVKLNSIESGATADQTNAEIKTAYELNANTNAFTDDNVIKLDSVEAGAAPDMSDVEIKTAYENNADTNAFTDSYMATVDDNASSVTRLLGIQDSGFEPNGFDIYDVPTLGIMELCPVAANGMYWRIDQNNAFIKITDATTFGDGVTPLEDRTFAHYKAAGQDEFSFWAKGYHIVKTTTQTIELSLAAGKQIVVYELNEAKDDAVLKVEDTVHNAIYVDTICAVISGNPTSAMKVVFANERHGKDMPGSTHEMLHETFGCQYGTGMDINGMVNDGSTFTSIDAGTVWDEDIAHTVVAATAAPFLYRDGLGDWVLENVAGAVTSTNDLAFTNATADDALYNLNNGDGTWSLVDTGLDYVIMHIFATNDAEYPIFKVVGQEIYSDRTTARNNLAGASTMLESGDLPTPEFVHLFSYILDAVGVIETGTDGEIYTDFRFGYPVSKY